MSAPIFTAKSGAVSLAFWENKTQKGETFLTYSLQKSWKGNDGKWQNTNFFGESDLVQALALLEATVKEIMQKKVSQSPSTASPRRPEHSSSAPMRPDTDADPFELPDGEVPF